MKIKCVFISVVLLSLPIICTAQIYTADEYKHNANNWSLKEDGEHLLIYEPEESKTWVKFWDDSRLELIGTPSLKLNFNGSLYWNSISTYYKRLRFTHNGTHAYCDYDDNFYFRADVNWISALVLQGDGNVAIGFGTTYTDGYRYTSNDLAVKGNVSIGYSSSTSAPSNGLIVHGKSYFNNKVGIYEENTGNYELYIAGDAYATGGWDEPSDKRLKTNIQTIDGALDKIISLRGTSFKHDLNNPRNKNLDPGKTYGLIAQELLEVIPELVKKDGTTENYYAVKYSGIIPFLIEAIKEQQNQIESLQSEISSLISDNSNYKSESFTAGIVDNPLLKFCTLAQNHPNPFTNDTQIRFVLPEEVKSSTLLINDLQGSQVESYNIKERGPSSITIFGYELEPGMYLYTLIADGQVVDTKRMILTD